MGMNVNAGSVGIDLKLLTGQFDRSLALARRRMTAFGRGVPMMRLPAIGIGAGLAGIGLATFALTKFGLAAADSESRLASLAKVSGLADAPLARLGKELRDIGRTVPVGLGDIFGIATMGSRMGVADRQLKAFTRDISELRTSVDMPIQEATEKLARLASVTGSGVGSIKAMGSVLTGLDQASTASARDILDITSRFVGMGRVLNIPVQRMMALSAAVREAGVSTEVAGTSLSQILGIMASSKGQAGFSRLAGLTRKQFAAQLQADPLQGLAMVGRGLSKMPATQAIDALAKLHINGQRARQTLLGLSLTVDKLGSFTRRADAEMLSMAAVTRSAAIEANTLKGQWTLIGNKWESTAAVLSTALMPAFKELAKGISSFMDDLGLAAEENQDTLRQFGENVGAALKDAGRVIRRWPTIWASVVRDVRLQWSRMQEKAEQVGAVLGQTWAAVGASISQFWTDLSATFRTGLSNIGTIFGQMVPALTRVVGSLFDSMFANLTARFHNWIVGLPTFVQTAIGMVGGPDLNRQLNAMIRQGKINVPKVGVDLAPIADAQRALKPMPGFKNPLAPFRAVGANLPNRADERKAINRQFREGEAARDQANADRIAKDARDKADAARVARLGDRLRIAGGALMAIPGLLNQPMGRMDRHREAQARQMEADLRKQADRFRRKLADPNRLLPPGLDRTLEQRAIDLDAAKAKPIEGRQAERAAANLAPKLDKLAASVDANTKIIMRLLEPGKLAGHWT